MKERARADIAPHGMPYRVVEGSGKFPTGYRYPECSDVAVDSKDNVYVFCRGAHPVIVFDREGNFLRSWEEEAPSRDSTP